MISVRRTSVPSALANGNGSSAGKEQKSWEDYYRLGRHRDPEAAKPKFSAYRLESVKTALVDMFHGKCAYCESQIQVVTWGDVEHYRPKGAIQFDSGSKKKPGYWWLASDWSNLLLACNRCNSLNRQEYEGEVDKRKFGKGNKFPLVDDDKRPDWPDHNPFDWQNKERNEAPLLLDPCRDQPEHSLRCEVASDVETRGTLTSLDERGKKSIDTFGLNRKPLVDRRREKLAAIDMLIDDVRLLQTDIADLKADIDAAADEPARVAQKEDRLRQKMARLILKQRVLEEHIGEKNEYLLMSRPLIGKFLQDEATPG